MRKLVKRHPAALKKGRQVRTKKRSDVEQRRLGENMRDIGQLQPVGITPQDEVIYGFGRVEAALLVGLESVDCIVIDEPLDEDGILCVQYSENAKRKALSGFDRWQACQELVNRHTDWSLKQVADRLHISQSECTHAMAPSRCCKEVQDALAEGKIPLSACYAISKAASVAEQLAMLAAYLNGSSRDALEHGRKSRRVASPAVRLNRVSIPLPHGLQVTVTAPEAIGWEQLNLALSDALKAAKKGQTELDLKTWVSVMRHKATVGGSADS